jgi:N-acetylglucosaminyldiphosphoundecaprenol N-acetyl-beta-D-mannosaminyltransferase
MSIQILGIPFEHTDKETVLTRVRESFLQKQNLRIATVNPEFLLAGIKDQNFRDSLTRADIRSVDGFGIKLIAWFHGVSLTRVTGADLLSDLLSWAEQHDVPLTIYNQENGLSTESDIRQALGHTYPRLKISCNRELSVYSLVLCTYGAPEQEFFIDMLGVAGIKMGVGGAIDYLTGKQKRAPQFLRTLGLEWLWRLVLQPKRIKRIWNAVVVFPLAVLFAKS